MKRVRSLCLVPSLLLVCLVATLAAAPWAGARVATPAAAAVRAAPPAVPDTLKVMELNIEYGGTQVSFAKVVEAVRAADPDVIGLEEAETNSGRLARAAGYPYWSDTVQVVSRYPIIQTAEAAGAYVYILVAPGRCVAVSNVHLPSAPYGPNLIRNGATAARVVANEEKARLPYIQTQLRVLPPLAAQGIPVFLLGDFNAPSWRDYTAAAVGTRPNVKFVVDWPVSEAVEKAGFSDSWRAVHPDPVESPGLTWWAPRPKVDGWNPQARDPKDRIDFIYAAGPAQTTTAQLAGEKGGPEVTFAVSPWPSDHRGVVSTFTVTPGPLPVLVAAAPTSARVGATVSVYWRATAAGAAAVALVREGGEADGAVWRRDLAAGESGSLQLATAGLAAGDYELLLLGAGDVVQARAPFWLLAPGAKPHVAVDKKTYAPGEPIVVSWKDAPANRWDWLGVYKAGAADPTVDYYLIWQYTGGPASGTSAGPVAGSLTFARDTVEGRPWPLKPGKYVLYYLLADGYKAVARATFRVK